MQPTNYCRQIKKQYTKDLSGITQHLEKVKAVFGHIPKDHMLGIKAKRRVMKLVDSAVKFVIPEDGIILEDRQLKAINDKRLELPYPTIVLEYSVDIDKFDTGIVYSKAMVLVTNMEDHFEMIISSFIPQVQEWMTQPRIVIPKENSIVIINGEAALRGVMLESGNLKENDYINEVRALYEFLNALSCRNVHVEKTTFDRKPNTGKKKKLKDHLPFDEYHYLTIDVPGKRYDLVNEGIMGDRRSPREHLRRGHIRKYEFGSIWINATIVNPGVGNSVTKSYIVRKECNL